MRRLPKRSSNSSLLQHLEQKHKRDFTSVRIKEIMPAQTVLSFMLCLEKVRNTMAGYDFLFRVWNRLLSSSTKCTVITCVTELSP